MFYLRPLDEGPVRARHRPRRHFAGVLSAMANPPSWSRKGRMGLGVWVELPDRVAPRRPYLPHVLHAGDRVHTGIRGLARVELPQGAVAWLAAETIFRVAGDGAFPTTRQRVRVAVEPGLVRIRSPLRRPLEIEVPYGLLHLVWGEVFLDVPTRSPDEADPASRARVYVVKGRGRLHGRGRYRRESLRFQAGETLTWSTTDPAYWGRARTAAKDLEELREFFLDLRPDELQQVDAAPPLPITQPRKVEGLVQKVGVGGSGPGTSSGPGKPGPGPKPPTKPPTPAPKPTRPPTPPPTDDPFGGPDPFGGGDPFGDEDPFGDDPFGGGDSFGDDF